ncbi:MAG: hypothetical protein D3922_09320 [Candidatus Electrothrix sp. AR1]|nr:hypothetical protein [Candidatus Electrothrix sp. AR1]
MSEQSRADMIKKTGQSDTEQKLPYKKPTMTPVSLFADEVLLGCGKHQVTQPGCQSAGAS